VTTISPDRGWTAPAVDRVWPDLVSDERASLQQWLDYQRATLLTKCAGLTAEQLRERAVRPSKLSLLGLVRHMSDVERWWFRMHADGEDVGYEFATDEAETLDFEGIDDADPAADLLSYQREIAACDAVMAGKQLDDVVPSRGHHPERVRDLRWIYQHMIEEYARHNGHADLLRERIDGATGQ
jgi:uncharacterized damage-inducible protein DinB